MTYYPPSPPSGPPGWTPGEGPPTGSYGGYPQQAAQVCAWHPDRVTALSCTRCGRPACPDCLQPASVGFHCRACQAQTRQAQPVARTVSGSVMGQQPVVTFVLIAINVLVFVITMIQAGGESRLFRSSILRDGEMWPNGVAQGEYWRVITSGFLHLSVIHVAMNMVSLYVLGLALERMVGRNRFLAVYLLSLVGGSVGVMLLADPASAAAGASGAIFGLMGALVVAFRRFRLDIRQLGGILVLNLGITFFLRDTISWEGHLGGLAVGAIAGAIMVYLPQKDRTRNQVMACVGLALVMFVVLALRGGFIAS